MICETTNKQITKDVLNKMIDELKKYIKVEGGIINELTNLKDIFEIYANIGEKHYILIFTEILEAILNKQNFNTNDITEIVTKHKPINKINKIYKKIETSTKKFNSFVCVDNVDEDGDTSNCLLPVPEGDPLQYDQPTDLCVVKMIIKDGTMGHCIENEAKIAEIVQIKTKYYTVHFIPLIQELNESINSILKNNPQEDQPVPLSDFDVNDYNISATLDDTKKYSLFISIDDLFSNISIAASTFNIEDIITHFTAIKDIITHFTAIKAKMSV